MRTGLVDALIEHLVDEPGSYALKTAFNVVVASAVLARADPAAGCSWVTGGSARPGHQGRRAGPLATGTTVVVRRLRSSLATGQPDDRPGWPGTPSEG